MPPQPDSREWTLLIGPEGTSVLPGEQRGYIGAERVIVVPREMERDADLVGEIASLRAALSAAEAKLAEAERERDEAKIRLVDAGGGPDEREAEWKRAWKMRLDELDALTAQRDSLAEALREIVELTRRNVPHDREAAYSLALATLSALGPDRGEG